MSQEQEAVIEEKASLPPLRKLPRKENPPLSTTWPAVLRYYLAVKKSVTPEQLAEVVRVQVSKAIETGDSRAADFVRKVLLPDDWLKQLDDAAPEGKRVIEAKAELINRLGAIEQALDKRKTNGTGS